MKEISDKIMRRSITFAPGCSKDYIDLVNKLLQKEPNARIPLIKVFDHPWVKFFEEKYNLKKVQPSPQQVPEKQSYIKT